MMTMVSRKRALLAALAFGITVSVSPGPALANNLPCPATTGTPAVPLVHKCVTVEILSFTSGPGGGGQVMITVVNQFTGQPLAGEWIAFSGASFTLGNPVVPGITLANGSFTTSFTTSAASVTITGESCNYPKLIATYCESSSDSA